MNEVFLIGKIITNVEFKFIINSKKHKSIAKFWLEIENNQRVLINSYNEIADFVFRKLEQGMQIFVYGIVGKDMVEVRKIKII